MTLLKSLSSSRPHSPHPVRVGRDLPDPATRRRRGALSAEPRVPAPVLPRTPPGRGPAALASALAFASAPRTVRSAAPCAGMARVLERGTRRGFPKFQRHQGSSLDRSFLGKPLPTLLPCCNGKLQGERTRDRAGITGQETPLWSWLLSGKATWGGWRRSGPEAPGKRRGGEGIPGGRPSKGGEGGLNGAAQSDQDDDNADTAGGKPGPSL